MLSRVEPEGIDIDRRQDARDHQTHLFAHLTLTTWLDGVRTLSTKYNVIWLGT